MTYPIPPRRVDSLGADVSVPRPARALGIDASLPGRAGAAARVRLERMDDPIRVEVERLPGSRVTVFNDLGSTARHFDMGRAKQEEVDIAYRELRTLVAPGAEKLNFNLSKMTVWYKEGGIEYTKDLQEIVERRPECMEKFRKLEDLIRPVWGGSLRSQFIQSGSKSHSHSMKAMARKNEALQSLPKDKYAESAKLAMELYAKKEVDPVKQDAALKRITAIERMLDPQIKKVKAKLAAEVTSLGTATDVQKPAIEAKIKELKAIEKKLDVDRLGLYVAAAFTPQPAHPNVAQALANAKKAAHDAQEVLQEHIDKVREEMRYTGVRRNWPTWLPERIRGKEMPIAENKVFSVDAAALVFSSLPIGLARRGALDFWRSQKAFQKVDTLEDELIRFALAGDATVPMLDAMIASVTDVALRDDMARDFTGSKTVVTNILNGSAPYPPAAFPAAATIDAKIDHLKSAAGYAFE